MFTLNGYGQNYQTVTSNRIAYFGKEARTVQCVRIDSTHCESDSVLYPFTVIQEGDAGCYSLTNASWIGKKIIIKENGENLFVNKWNEPITINTHAALNDSWIAFQKANHFIIEAKVTEHDVCSFLTLNDSVKTIEFTVYDHDFVPIIHHLNGKTIQISKNYGLIKTLIFSDFPFYSSYPVEVEENNLLGLSDPLVGYQNLTWFEVNDFQVGDEFHIHTRFSYAPPWYNEEEKIIQKYVERIDYEDSIVYHYLQKKEALYQDEEQNNTTYSEDVLKKVVVAKPDFDKLSGEPTVYFEDATYHYMQAGSPLSKYKSDGDIFYRSTDSCWLPLTICGDCAAVIDIYTKGLGGPYYSCDEYMTVSKRELVYYKKGDVTYGTPLQLLNIVENEKLTSVNIYPNPVKNGIATVSIKNSPYSDFTIRIMDVTGKIMETEELHSASSAINLSSLKSGIYIYTIFIGGQKMKTGKLVILQE